MRSAELAKVAGVSVRTLRHYHALGLLPEPPRQPNGYRDYTAFDLAEVLRIKRLAGLGFSLAEIGAMQRDGGEGSEAAKQNAEDEALARLDAELAQQIAQLQEQRRTIAQLRAEKLNPTLPVRFARVVNRLYGKPIEEVWADNPGNKSDQAALLITAQIYDEADIEELERFADRMEELGLLEPLRHLEARLGELPPDAPQPMRDKLVAEAVELLTPAFACLDPANWQPGEDEALWTIIDGLLDTSQNEAQREVSARIDAAIEGAVHGKPILLKYPVDPDATS